MATSAATLVQRTRRFLGDWPENDVLTASVAAAGTSLTVADGTLYSQGQILQIDTDALYVTANGSGTTVPVRHGARGTTAASHANGATILLRPHFLDIEILDALNSGINASYPWLYDAVVDESITTASGTYEYTIPNQNLSVPIVAIAKVQFRENSDLAFREIRTWDVLRGATPKIRFRRDLPGGTLRLIGFSPLPPLTDLTSTLDTSFPANAEDALTLYASQFLLSSGEARRVREDTGARDDRENANRPGSSSAAAQGLLQRFQMRLMSSGMPPMARTVKSVI